MAECLAEVGIAFLFAPAIHSAAKYVQTARRETRLRTVFNLLGPLTNPAGASAQVVGVYALELVEKLALVPTGRLVVLGEPGAGKTMLMIRLVLDLSHLWSSTVPGLRAIARTASAARNRPASP